MNLNALERMPAHQVIQLLDENGTCLSVRYEPKFVVYLYRVSDLLVEVFYHHKSGFLKAEGLAKGRLSMYQTNERPQGFFEGFLARAVAFAGL